jgi:Holliday junction DNA helicase RuvB
MDFKGFARSPLDIAREYERIDRTEDFLRTQEQAALNAEREFGGSATATTAIPVQPVSTQDRSKNVLRPETFADVVGQDRAKRLIQRMVENARRRNRRLDHLLMVGPSGTGKTTLAHVAAHELDAQVWQLEAPISTDTLLELRESMEPGDVLFIDEIHQQAISERRGKSASTQPEVLFGVMEDFTIATAQGILAFPEITVMGATTDEGMLPDAFVNRFPIKPRLERYSEQDMVKIAEHNAKALGVRLGDGSAEIFAKASRGVPREVNNFMRNAAALTDYYVTPELASEVVQDLNGMTLDGLTADMQAMLTFIYTTGKHTRQADNETTYSASVGTIATGIGKSRDQKAIQLRVEPWLIEKGYVQVAPRGRALTDAGIVRARELLKEAH